MVKREITRLITKYGFSPAEIGKVNVIISEMTSNLIKHNTTNGEILVKVFGVDNSGLEILCLDNGPGMSDVSLMVEDGVSTAGTSGEGLGAIKRMADEFDIFSCLGLGTFLLARLYKARHKPKPGAVVKFEVGVIKVPKIRETHCGDSWAMRVEGNKCFFLVADGLGHGEHAEIASQKAAEVFLENTHLLLPDLMRELHINLKETRGAVGNAAVIDMESKTLAYCGVGNISGRVLLGGETGKSVISYNGILGHNIPSSLHNHEIPWNNNSVLVLHSDGIKSKWDLTKYKDLLRHNLSLVAAVLYKIHARGTDDTLVLLCRTRA